jgi:hypothetical protein
MMTVHPPASMNALADGCSANMRVTSRLVADKVGDRKEAGSRDKIATATGA